MLQYITNTNSAVPVSDQILQVIEGGGRWIQIRMKEAPDEDIRTVVEKVLPKCLETETFLLLDDRVELAKELNVGGVHLGREDMLPAKARILLGAGAVIGVTANTFDDIIACRSLDIDYFGFGPFTQTETKKNLAPILGLEGLCELNRRMREEDINIARVAVGGITLEDVDPIMETGVNGIAVSGAIAFAPDIAEATGRFLEKLKPYF